MEKNSRLTKGFKVIIITTVLWSAFGLSRPAFADLPVVRIELAHGNWISLYGDSIDDNNLPCRRQWLLQMSVQSSDIVTGPRFEFHSARSFADLDPYPTLFTPPSTYLWDYPDRSLAINQWPINLDSVDGGVIESPGFIAVRSVDNPLLLSDVTVQTMDFTLKFEKPLSPGINSIYVRLGTFIEDQSIVEESVLSQNDVLGWSNNGDGSWGSNPNDIIVGTSYNFQVHIQCTKRPQYSDTAIYHKPQAFVLTAEWNNLPVVNGPNTVIIHPEGETAYYQLNESVEWNRSTSLNRQDVFLNSVSLPIDDSNPDVNAIMLYYGRDNAAGIYLGHSFVIEVQGKNVVAAEVTTPTGRIWPLEIDEDWMEWGAEYLTPADLTALGIVEGTYSFAFHGLLGSTITASVNMTFDTPTQSPNITYPNHWDKNVKLPLTVTWEPVQDTSINTVVVMLDDEEDYWDFYAELSPDQSSCPVSDIPPYDSINCGVAFANTQTGQTPSGIEWSTYGYSLQSIHFTSGTFRGDFDGDGDVEFQDFAIIARAWLSKAGDPDWNPACDISEPEESIIDWSDLAVFTQDWLEGVE